VIEAVHICYVSLYFHQENNGGGIASYVQSLAKEFIRDGHFMLTKCAPLEFAGHILFTARKVC
jgi:hypothetical protein